MAMSEEAKQLCLHPDGISPKFAKSVAAGLFVVSLIVLVSYPGPITGLICGYLLKSMFPVGGDFYMQGMNPPWR